MDPAQEMQTGAAWAAVLAAGIGCAIFGILVDLAEAFPRFSKLLNIYDGAGDLSGKSTAAVVLWLTAWVVLDLRWRRRKMQHTGMITAITMFLMAIGLLAVFPPVMDWAARK